MIAGVAAGHPATAAAGAEILADGGTAADAAVGAGLASCVAETVMTGLLGGGHAIYYDAATGVARNLDCFVAVPGSAARARAGARALEVPFGEELVHYAIGASSCAVPGRAGRARRAWRAHGRLPWARLVEPALRARARRRRDAGGARRVPRDARAGDDDARGRAHLRARRHAARAGRPARAARARRGARVARDEGAAGAYSGTIGAALLELSRERGGLVTADDLDGLRRRLERRRSRRRGSGVASSRAAASPAFPRRSRGCRTPRAVPASASCSLVAALDGAARSGDAHDEPRHASTPTATRAC